MKSDQKSFEIDVANPNIRATDRSGTGADLSRLLKLAEFAMLKLRLHPRSELSIQLVNESEMERLHIQYMDEPGATDVLSFPMDECKAPGPNELAAAANLGDIAICPQFAARQAEAAGHSTAAELDLLLIHGVLHLLGHDHAQPEEHAVMFGLQADLLDAWAVESGGSK